MSNFAQARRWTSPRTGIVYPVEWTVRAGGKELKLVPLFDDQENDTRLSTGAIYWEGAVRAFDNSSQVGRGYLELTGIRRTLASALESKVRRTVRCQPRS